MNDRGKISEKFDEYVDDIVDSGGLVSTCDYESFEAGWQAARAQGEPVVYQVLDSEGNHVDWASTINEAKQEACEPGDWFRPLYAHPPSGANQGGVPEDRKAFWQKLTAFVDDYVNGYEFRGDEGDYTPNEESSF